MTQPARGSSSQTEGPQRWATRPRFSPRGPWTEMRGWGCTGRAGAPLHWMSGVNTGGEALPTQARPGCHPRQGDGAGAPLTPSVKCGRYNGSGRGTPTGGSRAPCTPPHPASLCRGKQGHALPRGEQERGQLISGQTLEKEQLCSGHTQLSHVFPVSLPVLRAPRCPSSGRKLRPRQRGLPHVGREREHPRAGEVAAGGELPLQVPTDSTGLPRASPGFPSLFCGP